MSENKSNWPDNHDECVAKARADFMSECAHAPRYWLDVGIDFLSFEQPGRYHEPDPSARGVFATLTPEQRAKVIELLERCVTGTVFTLLCELDQFVGAEIEITVRETASGRGFQIAPTATELHEEFVSAFAKQQLSGASRIA